jgi:hypothetical protein
MGKLLAIALLTTTTAAAFFQPILMGKPRDKEAQRIVDPIVISPPAEELMKSRALESMP